MPAEIQLVPEQLDQLLDKADETSLVPEISALNLKLDSLVEITTNLNVALGQVVVNIGKIEVAIGDLTIPEINFAGLVEAIQTLTQAVQDLQYNTLQLDLGQMKIVVYGRETIGVIP